MLSDKEKKRYSRHLLLGDIGEAGQLKLSQSKVLIIGLGGLGSPVALYLAASGIGHMLLADGDTLDVTNLQRQVMFDSHGAGKLKADLAEVRLSELNPEVEIDVIDQALTEDDLEEYVPGVDLVLDCSDNFQTRFAINRECVAAGTPLVSGAAIRMEGQIISFIPGVDGPCYQCLYQADLENAETCAMEGVLAPLVGVIGSLQAMQAMMILTGMEKALTGKLILVDGERMDWRTVKVPRDPACPVCGA